MLHEPLKTTPSEHAPDAVHEPESASALHFARVMQESQRMESVGLLASGLVHDFKNALAVMIGQVQIIQRDLPDEMGDRLEKIVRTGNRAAMLASMLLNVAGNKSAVAEVVEINVVIQECLRLLNASYGRRVRFCADHIDPGAYVCLSLVEMNQILFNLCMNAAQVTEPGGEVELRVERVSSESAPEQQDVVIAVRDFGPGIGKDLHERIFEPFFSTREGGTGLGLSVVRSLVENAGGRVELQSASGRGSTFKVFLPCAQRPSNDMPSERKAGGGKGETILVADAEPLVCEMLSSLLSLNGYRVESACSAEDVYAALQAPDTPASLLLLDSILRGVPCTQVCARVKKVRADLPVAIMTSQGITDEVEECLRSGHACGILEKPFLVGDLLSVIQMHKQCQSPHA